MKLLEQKVVLLALFTVLASLSGCGGLKNSLKVAATEAKSGVVAMESAASRGIGSRHDGYYSDNGHQSTAAKLRAPANQVYYFTFDNSKVQQEDIASIDAQANYLIKHNKARIRLEGHTDERGSREYNIALGWRRAKAVARLMEQLGVPSKQLVIISYGEEKPAVQGEDEAAYQRNRRVRLVYEVR